MKPTCQLKTPPLSSGKTAHSAVVKQRSKFDSASLRISKNRNRIAQIRKGRLPSVILQSTSPISGIWIPARHYGPIHRNRRWVIGKSGKILWEPELPEGADKKEEAILRIAQEVRLKKGDISGILRFSGTSKTGITWSLPPVASCPQIDETCGGCYALDGFYRTNVAAQVNRVLRLEYLKSLIAGEGLDEWIDWIVEKLARLRPVEAIPGDKLDATLRAHLHNHGITSKSVPFFRWHDSGDLFHSSYAKAVFEVCRRTPGVMHWIPTRMGNLIASLVSSGGRIPANLAVQISCNKGGILELAQIEAMRLIRHHQPDARIGLTYSMEGVANRKLPAATVLAALGEKATICPATVAAEREDRTCAGCRRCWGTAEPDHIVVYATHRGD